MILLGSIEHDYVNLEPNGKLAQKGEYGTWNQRFRGSVLSGVIFVLLEFFIFM